MVSALYDGGGMGGPLPLKKLNNDGSLWTPDDGGGMGGPPPGAPYRATVELSPNLEFVGLGGAVEWRPLYGGGESPTHSFDIPPGLPGDAHSFSATVRAVEEGYAHVSYYGEYHSAMIEMYVGDRAGLLVDDYHRAASPCRTCRGSGRAEPAGMRPRRGSQSERLPAQKLHINQSAWRPRPCG